ncbi:T9SS type A sorting domain-containing protein [Ulvibacter sp. MAR_2010_11]|uniref:T9SS type A sorting domain-containing protein n=1 Tax=Ulvibacter sp. MAR_2010_11 TaxID=1250229 RepID=UPI000C2BD878
MEISPAIKIKSIQVSNLLGEIIQTKTENFNQVNESAFKIGVYFLRLNTDVGSVVKKLVKR